MSRSNSLAAIIAALQNGNLTIVTDPASLDNECQCAGCRRLRTAEDKLGRRGEHIEQMAAPVPNDPDKVMISASAQAILRETISSLVNLFGQTVATMVWCQTPTYAEKQEEFFRDRMPGTPKGEECSERIRRLAEAFLSDVSNPAANNGIVKGILAESPGMSQMAFECRFIVRVTHYAVSLMNIHLEKAYTDQVQSVDKKWREPGKGESSEASEAGKPSEASKPSEVEVKGAQTVIDPLTLRSNDSFSIIHADTGTNIRCRVTRVNGGNVFTFGKKLKLGDFIISKNDPMLRAPVTPDTE